MALFDHRNVVIVSKAISGDGCTRAGWKKNVPVGVGSIEHEGDAKYWLSPWGEYPRVSGCISFSGP